MRLSVTMESPDFELKIFSNTCTLTWTIFRCFCLGFLSVEAPRHFPWYKRHLFEEIVNFYWNVLRGTKAMTRPDYTKQRQSLNPKFSVLHKYSLSIIRNSNSNIISKIAKSNNLFLYNVLHQRFGGDSLTIVQVQMNTNTQVWGHLKHALCWFSELR